LVQYTLSDRSYLGGTRIVFISGPLHLDAAVGLTHRMLLTNFLEHGARGITLKRLDRKAKEGQKQSWNNFGGTASVANPRPSPTIFKQM
jgi:hypothetical protein